MPLACPRCNVSLEPAIERTPAGRIELDYCRSCRGVWFDRHELATLLGLGNEEAFSITTPLLRGGKPSVACPRDSEVGTFERSFARELDAGAASGPLVIDQCPECEGIWLDGGELERVAAAMRTPSAQRAVAGMKDASTLTWLFLILTGLPIEEWNPRSRWPRAVAALEIACVAAFVWQLTQAGAKGSPLPRLELVPSALAAAAVPSTLVSYLFLHAGLAHLLGNLYFLWLFGDNVEDRLGSGRLLAVYFIAGIAAGLVHVLLTTQPDLPIVGASGAISGVLAAYALLFPRARLVSMFLFVRIRWRAGAYLAMWFALQAIGVLRGTPGIAWWAHIGGFIAGGLTAIALGAARQPTPVLVPQRA